MFSMPRESDLVELLVFGQGRIGPIKSFRVYISRTNQIAALGYVSCTNQSVVFVLWFERCSNFNEVMGNSERAVRKLESSFRLGSVGFSVFLNVYFTALYEKCDTTGQMKDIRLPIVNVLLML